MDIRRLCCASSRGTPASIALLACGLAAGLLAGCGGPDSSATPEAAPSLVVTTVRPAIREIERTLAASGSIAAWQEMSLGVELTGIRVAEVLVDVGDTVRGGQPLLRLDARTLKVQARQADASVAQAQASLKLARANAERGESLVREGLISSSNADELRATLTNAEAQLAVAQADREEARLRLGFATLAAPDAGVISSRTVQPGQIISSGMELLRLIRQGRLEWQAELTEADLGRVPVGTVVELTSPGGERVAGRVRAVSPAVNPDTRTGLLYADLPAPGDLRAGMFAQGQLLLGNAVATVLPRQSVVVRDGFPYVFVASTSGAMFNVEQRRISIGAQRGDYTEVVDGLKPGERIVVSGAGFLSDGDLVREVAGNGADTANGTAAIGTLAP
ncbi:MAG: efflux RND transporter periplasmic adaptor subunit [Gammaproteobacteria bacterium]|nr:efflux RND transporter periplasmic adaptor subunit [Gammaproteobacteria bacterium]MDH5275643.1 efflux RND transporter periplasmic adaptor subunit [Gammaproteobacteria bacterium]